MVQNVREGLTFKTVAECGEFLWVRHHELDDAIAYAKRNHFVSICVSSDSELTSADCQELCRELAVERLLFENIESIDWLPFMRCDESLNTLICSSEHSLVPFERLHNLSVFSGFWQPHFAGTIHKLTKLRDLRLYNFRPDSKSFRELSSLQNCLEKLFLANCSCTNLGGVGSLIKLKELDIALARKLKDISEIEQTNCLETLRILSCSRLDDVEAHLSKLTSLKELSLAGVGPLESLRFLDNLPALEFFSFVGTTVKDGNLQPLLRLRYAGFMDKRHYSMTFEQVKAHIIEGGRSLYTY